MEELRVLRKERGCIIFVKEKVEAFVIWGTEPINACHSTFKRVNPFPWHHLGEQMFQLFIA